MKRCFKCNESKPLKEFYRHSQMADGRLNKCKECTKADVKAYVNANAEARKTYEKQRAQRPDRILARKEYQRTPRGKRSHAKALRRHAEAYPEKAKAHRMVSNAIRDGKLYRQPCEVCGAKAEAHHEDYSKPLDVRWLCPKHHRARHKGEID